MSDIKVGEYCRTKEGCIAKLIKKGIASNIKESYMTFNDYIIGYYGSGYKRIYEDDFNKITKHSFNIIDLIQVGDYVNGYKVRGKTNEKVVVDYYCYSQELCDGQWLSLQKDLIKTIVTKKQFKDMEYKVGDRK